MSVNLLNLQITHLNCDMCDLAGSDAVFWPQEQAMQLRQGAVSGYKGYLNSNQSGLRSGHRELRVCSICHKICEAAWIKVAQDEVDLDRVFNEWSDSNE